MRRRLSLKPETYPESVNVDVAGISGKVNAHYPGRPVRNNGQESAEAIVSPVVLTGTKGQTENESSKDCNFGEERDADNEWDEPIGHGGR